MSGENSKHWRTRFHIPFRVALELRVAGIAHRHCPRSLRRATPGVEFLLQDAQPPHLFVIKKQYRQVDGSVTSVAFFYILDGTVYQAPTLHAALRSRIVSTAVHPLLQRL